MISLRSGAAASLAASLLLLTVSLPLWVHAQTASQSKPVVVATVNIYDAKILNQEGNTFSISFDLSNREDAQPGVRYAVQLVDSEQTVADEYVYPEVVNLDSHTNLVKTIEYTAPAYLSGTYQLLLVSENINGLVLAHASPGEVTLSGTGPYVEILPSTCFLQVERETGNKEYALDQGVDIAPSETLDITCTAENHSPSDLILQPLFKTFYRDVFGAQVETTDQPAKSVTLNAGQKKTFTLSLPKALTPQAYDVKLSFGNTPNVPSNSVTIHYVLRGGSATVQNLTLDKTAYQKGDTAEVSVFWTGPADNFLGSRAVPSSVEGMQATIRIADANGNPCGNDVAVLLDSTHPQQVIPFAVSRTCLAPTVTATLSDGSGTVLASSSFNFAASTTPDMPAPAAQGFTEGILIVAVLAILLIGGFVALRMRMAGMPNPPVALLFVLLVSAVFVGGLPQQANADTFTQKVFVDSTGGWGKWVQVTFDVTINKDTYVPGETITARGSARQTSCGNSFYSGIRATINGTTKEVYTRIITGYKDTVLGKEPIYAVVRSSNTFTAPDNPGNYNAGFFEELYAPTGGAGAGSKFCLPAGTPGTSGSSLRCVNFSSTMGMMSSPMSQFIAISPYNIPYTVAGTTTTTCTPTSRTCQPGGNLRDNCGDITTCQYGCSTVTNECKTLEQCTPSNVCNDAGTKVVNKCDRTHVIEDCAAQDMRCVSGQCVGDAIDFVPFDAFDWTGAAFTATGHLQAIPSLVHAGQTTRIYWKVTNTRGCTVTGSSGDEWSGLSSGTSGKTSRGINGQITYTLECQALPGATPATVRESVIVNMIPIFEEQ